MTLTVRLLAYEPGAGTHSAQLRPTTWSASLVHNAPGEGAMEIEIAKPVPGEELDRGADWLMRDCEVAIEVSAAEPVGGDDGFREVRNGRFLVVQEEHDLITKSSSAVRARLLPYAWLLTKARVWTGPTVEPGRREFTGTPGAIWSTLMAEAQERGALSTMSCRATAEYDSAGRPWETTTTQVLDIGQDYLAVLDQFISAGLVDAYTIGTELVLLRPDSDNLGEDPPVLRAGGELISAPREVDGSALATHAVAIGDEGVAVPVDSGALTSTSWGRWETSLSVSGVKDPAVIRSRARSALNLWASERVTTSAELSLADTGSLPFRDYDLGGWVQVAVGDGPAEVHQVRAIALRQPQTGPMVGQLELGRRKVIPERKLQKKVQQLTTSAAMGDFGAGRVVAPPVRTGGVVDLATFGPVADGEADDLPAFSAALAAVPAGGTLIVRPGTYYLADTWTIDRPCRIKSDGATILGIIGGGTTIRITSSDVTLEGLKIDGRRVAYTEGAVGVLIQGASAVSPVRRIRLRELEVANCGFRGIFAQYAEDVHIEACYVHNVVYSGIGFWSVNRGSISRCRVSNITNNGYVNNNAYGIELSRAETDSLTTDPRTSDVTVAECFISDVPTWEGIDTHAGQRIRIVDNTVLRCSRGIVVTSGDGAGQVPTFAPLRCLVRGNLIESGVSDGSRSYGIHFNGVLNGSTPGERATGVIADNLIVQHGIQTSASDSGAGAIRAYVTDGLVIRGNVVIEPGNIGINLVTHNRAYAVIGNVVMEPWSNTSGALPAAIRQYNGNSNGLVIGNQLIATGTKAGAVVRNQHGFRHNATASTVQVACNDFSAATVPQFPATLAGWVDGLWGTRTTRYTATGSETAAQIVAQLQAAGIFG